MGRTVLLIGLWLKVGEKCIMQILPIWSIFFSSFLQGWFLQRPQVSVLQTRVLQGPSARLQKVVALPVSPQSWEVVLLNHATTVHCVCPRAQILTASVATVCLDSRDPTVNWTSMSVHPGLATMGAPAKIWQITTSAIAPWDMQVMVFVTLEGWTMDGHGAHWLLIV